MFGIGKRKKEELIGRKEYQEDIGKLVRLLEQKQPSEEIQRLEKRQRKQESMLEELLELQDETQGELEEIKEYFQKKEAESLEQEKRFLGLILQYEEYLDKSYAFMETVSGTNECQEQKKLIEQVLEKRREALGIQKIHGENLPVNLNHMEVLEVEETSFQNRQNTVKQVIVPGWIYKGKIIQKAKVVAYRYKEVLCQK